MKNIIFLFSLLLSFESHAVFKSLFVNIEKDLEARVDKTAVEITPEAQEIYDLVKKEAQGCIQKVIVIGEDTRDGSDWDTGSKEKFLQVVCDGVSLHNGAKVMSYRYKGERIYFVPVKLEHDWCDFSQLHGVAMYRAKHIKGNGVANTPVRIGIIPGEKLEDCYEAAHVADIMDLGLKYITQYKY